MTTREHINKFKEKTGRTPSVVELSRDLKISSYASTKALMLYSQQPLPPEVVQPVEVKKKEITVIILRVFLILLSMMAFTLSVYFTGLWFSDKFHIVISGLISLSMVLFMVISPQTIRYIKNWAVKGVVFVSFIIALTFSMASTIAGQYNATTVIRESTKDLAAIYSNYEVREVELIELISEAKTDKAVHSEALVNLSNTEEKRLDNWQQIATERKYIDKFNLRTDNFNEELRELRGKMNTELSNGIVEEKRDFYTFISGLTGMEQSFTEFLISALPAIFIDLIAALCLNLALFIKGDKR